MSGAEAVTFRVVSWPRPTWVQQQSPWPARYLARSISHTLNHGMPALRRGGQVLSAAGRHRLPVVLPAAALRRGPTRRAPDLEVLLEDVAAAWPRLAAPSRWLPPSPPVLSVLAVQRAAGRFVFVFGDGPHPLLVLKPSAMGGVGQEALTLRQLEPLGVAPRALGTVGDHTVQEGLPGTPLWVRPAGRAGWSAPLLPVLDQVGEAMVAVAARTRTERATPTLGDELDVAASVLGAPHDGTLREVRDRLGGLDVRTLAHRDLNAQNCVVRGDELVGVVDWIDAWDDGVPGDDVLHLAVSMLEHGVALRRWSQREVGEAFERAWTDEPLFERARSWHRACVVAATGDDTLADPLRGAYLARRVARQAIGAERDLLEAGTLTRMLDVVLATAPDGRATGPLAPPSAS